MLPTEKLVRSNFVDGIKFNPDQIQVSSDYFNKKISLANLYGIGKGVLIGFLDSLELIIENNSLILKPGAAIDDDGNIIFVEKNHLVLSDVLSYKFENRSHIYIYILHESKMGDLLPSRSDKDVKIFYTINETFQIILSQKRIRDKSVVELGRVYINHKTADTIKKAINPFDAKENEIDLKYTPKIVGNNIAISKGDIFIISNTLKEYGNFLHEFGLRKSIFSMATVASFAFKIASDIKNTPSIAAWQLYEMLNDLLNITLNIEIEREDIVNTALWKNIVRLKNIFSFSENLRASYYHLLLNIDNSFFSKALLHFNNATIFDGDWDNILKEKKEEVTKKDYIVVGSASSCDLVVEGEDIAPQHAKIYKYETGYFIEDLYDTSGVYVNAERLERGIKKFIRKQDYVVLGKNGRVLNLQKIEL